MKTKLREGETFLPEKSHGTVKKNRVRNMTSPHLSQLSVLSLEFAFSPPTFFPFLTLFFLSLWFYFLPSSPVGFSCETRGEKGELERWFTFSGPF